ncbi:MAG: 16S rRNA (guanine(527)-N(7))-methyltransferase RsmG [Firmicutes bacterium]|nr:16S rRNA (guanine(527)-N(7))-methyltransferase RsmG [Bacillota bacterium]
MAEKIKGGPPEISSENTARGYLEEWGRSGEGLALDSAQIDLFMDYLAELMDWNKRINLTAIREEREIVQKHFVDSLTCLQAAPFPAGSRVIDVGSGAGFPGVPLKIARPDLAVTLLDSLQKRVAFLEHLREKLGLDGILVVHGRAEDLAHSPLHRESYDVATARAVARLRVLAEYVLPFVRVGGTFIAQKGPEAEAELEEALAAFKKLGGEFRRIKKLALPHEAGDRNLVVIEKVSPTPSNLPRKAGTPEKKPL